MFIHKVLPDTGSVAEPVVTTSEETLACTDVVKLTEGLSFIVFSFDANIFLSRILIA